ncbi:D-3-phosphoglycerate dehydrogenase [Microbispora rosea]|uniref:D-3-phosphoglycerate dehydrogenase n=1 Tax=Microbispora rosea TaxID=58117 RepID=A0A1N7FWU5_9ACTN|nr:D-isomer specific 2-hydroxyacid dehydrogenase family protein [Microbispora rosea]GIH51836.1 dihydrofolate reductase [Microbispora rosea subsp. rosea]SIS04784.1 D-3-phosphoglycerate dehydrogenase [Microbispora rosea]
MLTVCVAPADPPLIVESVRAAGGEVVGDPRRAEALVWTDSRPEGVRDYLTPSVRWVQLPSAGVERWTREGLVDSTRVWCSAAGAYAPQVAEHALALLLAGVHRLPAAARRRTWHRDQPGTLRGSTVAVVGAGGIGRAVIPALRALGADVLAVNRSGEPVEGAAETVPFDGLAAVWSRADHVILAAPATPETYRMVGRDQLRALGPCAWLVNVARGELVDTDALLAALRAGEIGGAALDVTDPEPLPDGHGLWAEPNALITSHSANPQARLDESLAERVRENVARYLRGEPLLGRIDPARGY